MPPKAAPKEPVFFVDRSLGGKLVVEALREAGAQVRSHDEVLPQNATDVEWLKYVGSNGWIALTKDDAIRRNPHEKAMYRDARVRLFTLARQDLPGPEMAALFVASLPGMRKRAATVAAPFLFSISRSGDFRRLD